MDVGKWQEEWSSEILLSYLWSGRQQSGSEQSQQIRSEMLHPIWTASPSFVLALKHCWECPLPPAMLTEPTSLLSCSTSLSPKTQRWYQTAPQPLWCHTARRMEAYVSEKCHSQRKEDNAFDEFYLDTIQSFLKGHYYDLSVNWSTHSTQTGM